MNKILMITLAVLVGATPGANAQLALAPSDPVNVLKWSRDVEGKPVYTRNYMNADGSSEFLKGYCLANITTSFKRYDSIQVRLDLLENVIIYKDSSGEKMATIPIRKIEFFACPELTNPVIFESGFPATGKQTSTSFYQVLVTGKIRLLKYYQVTFKDETPFNSAVSKRVYSREDVYYTYLPGNKMIKLAKNKESVMKVLNDKVSQLENFVSAKKIRFKKEEDLVSVFTYYNSL